MAIKPDDFVKFFGEQRASAILRTPIEDAAAPAMRAAVAGGFRVVEFTMTIPKVLERIAEFSSEPGLVVGAGTVLTPDDAAAAVDAGASFLVSPVVDEAVIEKALSLGVAMMPGTHTPTEMLRAHRAGAALQKLFPAPGIGAAFVKNCLGPLPFLRIVPTSGVDGDNVGDYLRAGAHAVGFVSPLFDAGDIERGDFDAIQSRAQRFLNAARAVESSRS